MHSALGAGPGTLQWIIAGYSLTFGLALIPGGRPGAEAARIDALFVPDLLRFGAQGTIGGQEPLIFVAALSQLTTRIGLIATVSTTFHHPFNLARLFGTLDHVSNGRAAWNLVTSSIGEENREGSCAGAASSNRTTTAPRSAKLDLELP